VYTISVPLSSTEEVGDSVTVATGFAEPVLIIMFVKGMGERSAFACA
jgi:hypothetical protein